MSDWPARGVTPWLYRPQQRPGTAGYVVYVPSDAPDVEARMRNALGPRLRFAHLEGRIWHVSNIGTMKDLGRRLRSTYGSCELWYEHATTNLCTDMCQDADPQFADMCQCPCIGFEHGKNSPGWTPVGDYLLVRVALGVSKIVLTG